SDLGIADIIKPKQWRAADSVPTRRLCHVVQSHRLRLEPRAGGVRPVAIEQRFPANLDCRARDRPRPRERAERGDIVRAAKHEAEPQPGKPIKLAEGAQHQKPWPARLGGQRYLWNR